jgi:hypothetical protein
VSGKLFRLLKGVAGGIRWEMSVYTDGQCTFVFHGDRKQMVDVALLFRSINSVVEAEGLPVRLAYPGLESGAKS